MKNHFIISYAGNKRREVETIYNNIDFNNIDTIIEPYCGSSAFSYYISTLHPKRYKYILNDYDSILIKLYNIISDINSTVEFEKKINEKAARIIDKKSYLKEITNKDKDVYDWFISRKIYSIKPGLYRMDYKYKYIDIINTPIIKFLRTENIEICNMNGVDIVDKYRDNKNALIFLDPPYLQSCNSYYDISKSDNTYNIYEYLFNNNIIKMKSKIILVLENNWIIKLLFKNIKNQIEYYKKYETSQRHTTHIIIKNFK